MLGAVPLQAPDAGCPRGHRGSMELGQLRRRRGRRQRRGHLPRRSSLRAVLGRRRADRGAGLRAPDDARLRRPGVRRALPVEPGRQPDGDDDHRGAPGAERHDASATRRCGCCWPTAAGRSWLCAAACATGSAHVAAAGGRGASSPTRRSGGFCSTPSPTIRPCCAAWSRRSAPTGCCSDPTTRSTWAIPDPVATVRAAGLDEPDAGARCCTATPSACLGWYRWRGGRRG